MGEEIYKFCIPEEIYGEVIDGIDLQILSSDSVRIIEAYIKQEGQLSDIQKRVLRQCEQELKIVTLKTSGQIQIYFTKLQVGVRDILNKISLTGG